MSDHDEHGRASARHDHPDSSFSGARFLAFAVLIAAAFAVLAFGTSHVSPPGVKPGTGTGTIPKDPDLWPTGQPNGSIVEPVRPKGVQPGLIQAFTGKNAAGGAASDRRVARLFALYVAAGEAPAAFLAPGPFSSTWTGAINLEVWDELSFMAEGAGSLTMKINGKLVLEVPRLSSDRWSAKASPLTRLEKGANKIELAYKSPEQGDAWVRLYWRAKEIAIEPVPPGVLTHDGADRDPVRDALRSGRELFATQRCARCHQPGDTGPAATAMPELAIDAPDLRDAGVRLNAAWMAAWIRDPQKLRPNASMPGLLHAGIGRSPGELDQDAADLAAFLAAGAPAAAAEKPAAAEQVQLGGWLFAQFGCLACHGPGSEAGADGRAHIDLRHVRAKWRADALLAFLRKPSSHYGWIRMPDFKLEPAQAEALAAFVRSDGLVKQVAAPAAIAGDAVRGKARAQTLGCASCHQLDGGVTAKPAAALTTLTASESGCLAAPTDAAKRGAAPAYALDAGQRLALRIFLGEGERARDSLRRRVPAEDGERRIAAQRCVACHERESEDSILSRLDDNVRAFIKTLPTSADQDLVDSANAAIEQRRPSLIYLGEKLHAPWMTAFISGAVDYRPRPWLRMHMPAFAANADVIARGVAAEHGYAGNTTPVPPPKELIAQGKELADNTGFNCIQCHGIGPEPAREVFEAPGVNLWYSTQRLRPDYYHRWVRAPLRIDQLSKMPQFANAQGETPLTDVLGGDARKQYEAIWQFLFTVPPPPPGGEKNPKHE